MSSSSTRTLTFVLLVLSLIISSCGLPLNEKQAKKGKLEAKLGFESQCLKSVGPALSEWLDGNGAPAKLSAAWDCLGSALEVFKEKVVGKESQRDEYSPKEVAAFFQNYVLKDVKFDDKALAEIMALKRLLVGGSENKLTRAEVEKLRDLMMVGKDVTVSLAPHMKIYTQNWQQERDFNKSKIQFKTASADLSKAVNKLTEVIVANQVDYDLQRIPNLVEELERITQSQGSLSTSVRKYIPVLVSAKNLLVEDEGSVLQRRHFPVVLRTAAATFNLYLEYNYFLKSYFQNKNLALLNEGQGLNSLTSLVESGLGIVQVLPDQRSTGVVPSAQFMPLWKSLKSSGLVGESITDQTISDLLPVLFDQVFLDPELRLQGRSVGGLSRLTLDYIRKEFSTWASVQKISEALFAEGSASGDRSLSGLKGFWTTAEDCLKAQAQDPKLCLGVLPDGVATEVGAGVLARAASQMKELFSSRTAVVHGQGQRLRIGDQAIPYSFSSVSNLNLSRALGRLIVQAYVSAPPTVPGSQNYLLTREGMHLAVKHFNPLAAELDLIEANSTSFANLRFFEANLFTPHGDGSEETDIKEISTLVTYILSGLSHHSSIDDRIRKIHCASQIRTFDSVDSGNDLVPVDCVINAYRAEMSYQSSTEDTLSVALPQMASFMRELDSKTINGENALKTFISGLMVASGWRNDGSGFVKMGDINLVVHVMQYIESVMQRFDSPRANVKDGILTRNEAFAGYPIFRNVINFLLMKKDTAQSVLNIAGDRFTKATYAFVLVHGGIPACDADSAELIKWTILPTAWKKIETDRAKLGEILSVLAFMTRAKEGDPIPGRCFYGTP